jgi:hypothetical protein
LPFAQQLGDGVEACSAHHGHRRQRLCLLEQRVAHRHADSPSAEIESQERLG